MKYSLKFSSQKTPCWGLVNNTTCVQSWSRSHCKKTSRWVSVVGKRVHLYIIRCSMYVSIHILTQLTYFTSMWGLSRLVPNIINMQVSLCVLLKFMTTVNLLLVFATYWEHGTGHINAEHGREMVKSNLSLAVPSSDCVHTVKGKAIQQQWMTTTQVLVTLWRVPASLSIMRKIQNQCTYFK